MSNIALTASKLLAAKGEPVTITFIGGGATDPITGETEAPAANVDYTANGYPSKYMQKDIDGTNIQAGDVRLILELVPVRPEVGCQATIDDGTYRVMDVQPIRLSGSDVIYICQLRAN
jgi:hypothetical protein